MVSKPGRPDCFPISRASLKIPHSDRALHSCTGEKLQQVWVGVEPDHVDHSAGPLKVVGAVMLLHVPNLHGAVTGAWTHTHTHEMLYHWEWSNCFYSNTNTADVLTPGVEVFQLLSLHLGFKFTNVPQPQGLCILALRLVGEVLRGPSGLSYDQFLFTDSYKIRYKNQTIEKVKQRPQMKHSVKAMVIKLFFPLSKPFEQANESLLY